MKIAVLTNDYPPSSRGGAGRIASVLADAWTARGYEVKVWHEPWDGSGSVPSRFARHIRDLQPRPRLVTEIVEWKPDILVSHNLTGCGWGTPDAVRARLPVRWIHVLHDVQAFEPSGRILHGESLSPLRHAWRRAWVVMRNRALGSPDLVVSPTQWLLEAHRAFGMFVDASVRVIPNPLFEAASGVEAAEREDRILFVGRVDRDKGADVLCAAWNRLLEPRPPLVFIGDGELVSAFQSQKGITCLGLLPSSDVAAWMRRSATLVVPSRLIENQPTVILEGLAAGCRIVASAIGGIPETLDGAGTLIEPGSVEVLREALVKAYAPDAEECRRVLGRHRVPVVVEAWEGAFRSNE